MSTGQGTVGQGTVGQGTVGQGTAGQGNAGQGNAGQGTAGQGNAGPGAPGFAFVGNGFMVTHSGRYIIVDPNNVSQRFDAFRSAQPFAGHLANALEHHWETHRPTQQITHHDLDPDQLS